MSAFIVGKPHIDAMVTLALRGPRGAGRWEWYGPRWLRPGTNPEEWVRVDYNGRPGMVSADELGQLLWRENLYSIHARYPDTLETGGGYPGPTDFTREQVDAYRYRPGSAVPRVPVPSAVEGLKLVACYEYQSCEHAGWESSEARGFCRSLTSELIDKLDGYGEAPWEWTGDYAESFAG